MTRAVALRKAGRAAEARLLLIELAAQCPDDAQTHYQAAWAHDLLGFEHDAVPFYERALALGLPDPDREGLLLGLGNSYRDVGRHADAAVLLRRGGLPRQRRDAVLRRGHIAAAGDPATRSPRRTMWCSAPVRHRR